MPFDGSLQERLPTADESHKAVLATQALVQLMDRATGNLSMRTIRNNNHEITIELPPAVSSLLLDLLMLIGKGEAVTLVPISAELTTQQAADILNVSRPFLVKLIEEQKIKCHKVGTHRRIKAEDVLAYKKQRDSAQDAALDELARLGQEYEAG